MTRLAWVGTADGVGRLVGGASIDAHDRGLLEGFGIFETMRAVRGSDGGVRFPLWRRHAARMAASASALGLPAPRFDLLCAAGVELLASAGLDDGALRVTLTAGVGAGAVVLTARPRPAVEVVRLSVISARRGAGDPTARHKTTSRLFWVLAQREAAAAGADEALALTADGCVAESTTGNLFADVRGVWVTPPADGAILPGVARGLLVEALGERVVERPLALEEVRSARRLAVTNAVHGPRVAVLAGPGGAVPEELAAAWREALGA